MKVIKGLALLCLLMLAGCQSEEETSQFLLACKYDAPATIEAMLNNGIDVDGQDKTGLSGLMVAAAENRRDVVALLLKRQAKPNLQSGALKAEFNPMGTFIERIRCCGAGDRKSVV